MTDCTRRRFGGSLGARRRGRDWCPGPTGEVLRLSVARTLRSTFEDDTYDDEPICFADRCYERARVVSGCAVVEYVDQLSEVRSERLFEHVAPVAFDSTSRSREYKRE